MLIFSLQLVLWSWADINPLKEFQVYLLTDFGFSASFLACLVLFIHCSGVWNLLVEIDFFLVRCGVDFTALCSVVIVDVSLIKICFGLRLIRMFVALEVDLFLLVNRDITSTTKHWFFGLERRWLF